MGTLAHVVAPGNIRTVSSVLAPANMRTLVIAAIDLYRRYISPYKGFKCAHNALHRRGSCSEYGRLVFAKRAFVDAVALMRRRFVQCKAAAMVLHATPLRTTAQDDRRGEEEGRKDKKKTQPCDCVPNFDCTPGSSTVDFCAGADACTF